MTNDKKKRGTKVLVKTKHRQGSQPADQTRAGAAAQSRKLSSKALTQTMRNARQYRFRAFVDSCSLAYNDGGLSCHD